ncbi:cystathionine gamma-lyase [Kordia sp. SMS9]|uniref:trans-sulfuration enzyme family protein n=1 Tax=Kordia sp. SMS9 TaxID=2282170 RepID=UPI000E0DF9C9|nr:PLP-dependent aspartate aminotransferase family protein [Kordia sp. SMS9]AXG70664.1 cystathionine gamma-lyase [Kordia sp. SMS9]
MKKQHLGLNTVCTHTGEVKDTQFKGAVSPLYMSSSYAFEDIDEKRYPRYFNTPNQQALCKKVAALEHTEAALIFGSGMAAVSTSLLAFLHKGDHVILQNALYGGTMNLVLEEFDKYGIEYSFTKSLDRKDFKKEIRKNTKVIYIETPSNPLLKVTDIRKVVKLAKKHNLITMIDNTFASPVNQLPATLGVDIMIHSATKYFGGHSDILAGAVAASAAHINQIFQLAKNLGGSLSDFTVWMLERSMKTLGIRVKEQNKNALKLANFLEQHEAVANVYYPGLKSHEDHKLAKSQMSGFGGMMSFELKPEYNVSKFFKSLKLIKPSMSLAGVESTVLSPTQTSHALLTPEERKKQGIADGLIRFSVGIEDRKDIIADLNQAVKKAKKK